MGLTHVTVTLSNLKADGESFEDEFLVDTGAIDCLAPSSALKNKRGQTPIDSAIDAAPQQIKTHPSFNAQRE